MLKAMRERFNQKRAEWAVETQQRIEEYAEQTRAQTLKKMQEEEEMNTMLHHEIDKYLDTIHPSFLLNPDVSRSLYQRLLARSQGRTPISLSLTSEMRLALDFYHSDLSIFIRLLEKKGFKWRGNENKFLSALLNKLSENNYRRYMDRYGDFAMEGQSLEEALLKYLEVVEDHNKFESGRIDFLNKYLINKGLLASDYTNKKLKKLVKTVGKLHEDDYKLVRLEKRMQGIG
ncbi:hypothetical protein [Alteribacillus iranensis]|uniref:Uncharacterized protein n=1 Tax=Alteribacillus iranensis TaxID=930128 RepID=A0A1I1ZVG1_9BACI|nr:hypothetical protein [Alteribacillus iranensis]SFE35784.1 hypothetical protein SAMN05192532_101477 [Alteribacillus iranensis]